MAIRDKVAMLVSQLSPMMQAAGANVASSGANALQGGALALAGAGDAAFRQGGVIGNALLPLSGASNLLHSGSQNLLNMGPTAQTALGYGALGAGTLAAGATAGAVASQAKKKRARLAGQDLGAQLGVQMPGLVLIN
jgi:hypothetical protein